MEGCALQERGKDGKGNIGWRQGGGGTMRAEGGRGAKERGEKEGCHKDECVARPSEDENDLIQHKVL